MFTKLSRNQASRVRGALRAHSKSQIEIRGEFEAGGLKDKLENKCVLIFPRQFAGEITDRKRLYQEMTTVVRLREPKRSGKGLVSDKQFGLEGMFKQIEQLSLKEAPEELQAIIARLHLYAATFYDFLHRKQHKLKTQLPLTDQQQLEDYCSDLGKTIHRGTSALDKLASMLESDTIQRAPAKVARATCDVYEYCCYLYADMLQGILGQLHGQSETLDHIVANLNLNQEVENIRHRFFKHQFKWVTKDSNMKQREEAINRRRYLKRQIMAELYLDAKDMRRFWIEEHFGGMLAATLAAAWATAIHLSLIISGNSLQMAELGLSSAFIFGAVITAYVLKDRIKDFGKIYFRRSFSKYLADRIWVVFGKEKQRKKVPKLAKIFEKAQLEDTCQTLADCQINLPDEVEFDSLSSKAIILSQSVRFYRSLLKQPLQSLRYINRINLDKFFGLLDDKNVPLYELEPQGTVIKIDLPKLYYCYCIICSRSSQNQPWQQTIYKLSLAKDGISRITKI